MRKTLGIGLTVLAAAVIWALAGSNTQAFHSGGVAECNGCHSMHAPAANGSHLLIKTDPSSTCLSCHMNAADTGPSSYHIATVDASMPAGTAPLQRTPGGDFGWLKKTYTFTIRGTVNTELGQTHGHNVVSADYGYAADTTNTTAPGGTMGASQLGCTSCHDPHSGIRRLSDGTYARGGAPIIGSGSYATSAEPAAGQAVGVYRLLRGLGDVGSGGTFPNGVALAVAPSTYNRTESSTMTRVAYGSSGTNQWGEWCATCHTDMHKAMPFSHPVDYNLSTANAGLYNAYVKSGDLTGSAASSFTSLVPFAEKNATITTLKSHAKNDNTYLNGPVSTDEVMCLSCHRAHASGWPSMLRWNNEYEFMVYGGAYFTGSKDHGTSRGRTSEAEAAAAYNDIPATKFATYQRVLCNKCHAKD